MTRIFKIFSIFLFLFLAFGTAYAYDFNVDTISFLLGPAIAGPNQSLNFPNPTLDTKGYFLFWIRLSNIDTTDTGVEIYCGAVLKETIIDTDFHFLNLSCKDSVEIRNTFENTKSLNLKINTDFNFNINGEPDSPYQFDFIKQLSDIVLVATILIIFIISLICFK